MPMWRYVLPFLTLVPIMAPAASAQPYRAGQVWEYHTRPGEAGSLLKIVKVDVDPQLGEIFHLRVIGVKVMNPNTPGKLSTELPHVPVSRKTLDSSVTRLSHATAAFPDYREGYAAWKRACDAGGAGMFTIPVAEITSVVEEGLRSNRRAP